MGKRESERPSWGGGHERETEGQRDRARAKETNLRRELKSCRARGLLCSAPGTPGGGAGDDVAAQAAASERLVGGEPK